MRMAAYRFFFSVFVALMIAVSAAPGRALERQPGADYHARREALAKKAGVVVLFAPIEGPDEVYEFRQENNFFYLSGQTEPGTALLIAPAAEARGDSPARAYTEIFFLPPHNVRREKFTAHTRGPENPNAPKITGCDRVEEMSKLPEEVEKAMAGARPVVYGDVSSDGEPSAHSAPLTFLKRSNAVVIFQDVNPFLTSLRTYKDAGEVALIRKAVD